MKELVIISGKGGTGKTSITASFAALAKGESVLADCDVDAADLHLILKPEISCRTEFRSGHKAIVSKEKCVGCGKCVRVCRFSAVGVNADVSPNEGVTYHIDDIACEGCGVCVRFCPEGAIEFPEEVCGEWFVSRTRFGTMVHAKLGIAAENSGRLVTLVRNRAKEIAQEQKKEFVLIDGSPGIGCPVIASLTAADAALIVAEPTVSGDHDLRRIAGLTKQLGVKTFVSVNKWDVNPDAAGKIKEFALSQNLQFAGMARYDKAVTDSQRLQKAVVECCSGGVAEDIRNIWNNVTGQW
ncbi:MAG: ATP-binding protein [Chitinispirillaceae bacterium]